MGTPGRKETRSSGDEPPNRVTIRAAVDSEQVDDLVGRSARYPEVLLPGSTLRAQLALRIQPRWTEILPVGRSADGNLAGCNLKRFISQPLIGSPMTQVVGRVAKTLVVKYEPDDDHPSGRTHNEMILDSGSGVPLVVSSTCEGRIPLKLPKKDEIVHLCGVVECLPSFSLYRLFSPISGRITKTWECPDQDKGKWAIWGIVEIELLSSRVRKPTFSVSKVIEGGTC